MSPANIITAVFFIYWCACMGAWLYGSYYFLSIYWARFQSRPDPQGYWRKVTIGWGAFGGAVVVALIVGGALDLAGVWPHT